MIGGERLSQKTIVAIDCETSGLSPHKDGILQVGYAYRKPDGEVERWAQTTNPGMEYLANGRAEVALSINRLTRERIAASPPAHTISAELTKRLGAIGGSDGIEIRAYNMSFDRPFLQTYPWSIEDRLWGPCLMIAAATHLNASGKWVKLSEAVRRLGITWPAGEAHGADVDAHAALLVHEALQSKRSRQGVMFTPGESGGSHTF